MGASRRTGPNLLGWSYWAGAAGLLHWAKSAATGLGCSGPGLLPGCWSGLLPGCWVVLLRMGWPAGGQLLVAYQKMACCFYFYFFFLILSFSFFLSSSSLNFLFFSFGSTPLFIAGDVSPPGATAGGGVHGGVDGGGGVTVAVRRRRWLREEALGRI
ncbi:uncharacterized protein LOC105762500 [Gossypium raimondii]|uniref:uncharacterized protein LOC105762500 n=1 Tax=Gossypium raimondii TaxID=29730 RepID=UPI00227CBB92|nr:uncharacterized protein LOC105762500 [Gossypium raimondii]